MPIQTPTPLTLLRSPLLDKKNIQLWIKRDELTHAEVQGNKWRKLKYNIIEAQQLQKKHLLTFGGAFSNHLFSTAAAGKIFDFKTIGIVRGEKRLPLNPTLKSAEENGMQLHFVDRASYRQKEQLLSDLDIPLDDCYILPEGGTNEFAIQGCIELGKEILKQLDKNPDFICLSCGTGGTAAGVIEATSPSSAVIAFSALKGDFLKKEIQQLLENFSKKNVLNNFLLQTDYHFGGYAKHTPALLNFINNFKQEFGIQLDPIYTGKMFFGIFDLIKKDFFPRGSNIVGIHSGGLQGIAGFRERFGEVI